MPGEVDSGGIDGDGAALIVTPTNASIDVVRGGAELTGPTEVAFSVVFPEERVPATSARLPRERAVRGPGDVDAGWVGGGPAAEIVIRGAELVAPEEVAVRVVLPEERVVAAGVRLPGECAHCRASDIDTRRVSGSADGEFIPGRAEFAGPQRSAVRVVLSEERVVAAGVRLARECGACFSGDIHARRVGGEGGGLFVCG